MTTTTNQTKYIPIDQREPASVRAVILARSSDPGAKPEDMKTQVDRCVAFIAKMGWTLIYDPCTYAESRTGMHNVAHPKLDAVLKLAIAHAIDVIVCSELDRLDRKEELRYYAIYTARQYGVEFRFENMPPDGKMPEDMTGKMYMNIMQLLERLRLIVSMSACGQQNKHAMRLAYPMVAALAHCTATPRVNAAWASTASLWA